MREIKIREWDPVRQKAYGKFGLSYGVREDYDDMIAFRFEHTESMGDDLSKDRVLEQYIGIDDDNGNPIYEGDIVKTVNSGEIFQVKYMDDDKYPAFDLVGYDGDGNGISNYIIYDGLIVLGNIHENLDLLQE